MAAMNRLFLCHSDHDKDMLLSLSLSFIPHSLITASFMTSAYHLHHHHVIPLRGLKPVLGSCGWRLLDVVFTAVA
jgi:hypothetical protein